MLSVLTLAMEMASHPNIFGIAATISDCNLTFHKDTFQIKIFPRKIMPKDLGD